MLLIPAYAKVNLCLAVRGRRPDGYHDIDSVAVTVDWHDIVGVTLRPAATGAVRLRVTGNHSDADALGDGPDNLAARAAAAFGAAIGPVEIDVWLDKRLPSRAGLGGGSADAAAVLRGCAAQLVDGGFPGGSRHTRVNAASLAAAAASLGSDVPMLFRGGAQRMTGRGERLEALALPAISLAVAIAGSSDTAATYAAVETADFEGAGRGDRVAAALVAGARPDDDDVGSGLERAACRAHPELRRRLAALRSGVPQVRWHLTGSGGAVFAIAANPEHAADLAACARAAGFTARPCRTVAGPAVPD